jgi:hypothetical protein
VPLSTDEVIQHLLGLLTARIGNRLLAFFLQNHHYLRSPHPSVEDVKQSDQVFKKGIGYAPNTYECQEPPINLSNITFPAMILLQILCFFFDRFLSEP